MDKSSTKFCHYTSIENARNILSGECFYLSRMSDMNDMSEAYIHCDEDDRLFVLSFCHSESKNIPMFYLYSGIDGKGCRLQFTENKIKNIIDKAVLYPVNKSMKVLKRAIPQNEYEVMFDWIHYIAEDGFCVYRGNNLGRKYTSLDDAREILKKESKQYFIKNPIWRYESEYRIIVKFNSPMNCKKIALRFPMKELERGISVLCGPETTNAELYEYQDEFFNYGISKNNVKQFSEQVLDMKLIKRNENTFVNWNKNK